MTADLAMSAAGTAGMGDLVAQKEGAAPFVCKGGRSLDTKRFTYAGVVNFSVSNLVHFSLDEHSGVSEPFRSRY